MIKETTILYKIEKLVDSIDYKTAYIKIETNNKKLILEKDKKNKIGFRV